LKTKENTAKDFGMITDKEIDIIEQLGAGATGTVHLGVWRNAKVAVKILLHPSPGNESEFKAEAEKLST